MGESGINSREMVERIWHEVALRETLAAEPLDQSPPRFVELHHDMERHYLNARCVLDTRPSEVPAAPPLSRFKAHLKRRAGNFIVATLHRYFAEEQEFMAHLVRFQNNVAESHDQLARELAALHYTLRVESIALKQRIALLDEALGEGPRGDAGEFVSPGSGDPRTL